ncbi:Ecm9p ASCRUDRAFT_7135 [Ascoidea rubescens DSM 1968]|uniref:Protein prenylyltransferase n=1 Tax=Ascoidea rubescens DSM 1968 TaxID=1344418 RepID=A0A1D2VLU9_9ASCO|nr:hypothetical protein ASCRUDRAFT_7135 [Ascoidea rubescens DSM 1968]ODV62586.1 hypothetical protein ASCRUDRAFT_7135 [Ascoidea rubescens DSM 1968]
MKQLNENLGEIVWQFLDVVKTCDNIVFEVVSQHVFDSIGDAGEGTRSHSIFGIIAENDTAIGIYLSKPVYLLIFKQSHDRFNQYLAEKRLQRENSAAAGSVLSAGPLGESVQDELLLTDDVFYATIGLMLTTYEYHTCLNVHELMLKKYIKKHLNDKNYLSIITLLVKELNLLRLLLNSKLSNINKSSSLWLFLKKLYILLYNFDSNYLNYPFIIELILQSCRVHPYNYYAWSFTKWLINFLYYNNDQKLLSLFYTKFNKFSHSHINDNSSWSVLYDLIIPPKSSVVLFTITEYNSILASYNLNSDVFSFPLLPQNYNYRNSLNFQLSYQRIFHEQITWLETFNFNTFIVWNFIKNVLINFEKIYLNPQQLIKDKDKIVHLLQIQPQYQVKFPNNKEIIQATKDLSDFWSKIKDSLKTFESKNQIEIIIKNGYSTNSIDPNTLNNPKKYQNYIYQEDLKKFSNIKKILIWKEKFLE